MLKTFLLIRPFNLLMIAVCMLLVRYCLILPTFETERVAIGVMPEHLGRWSFLALVIGTCMIAAAGNIINDRFDGIADAVNKPGKNIIGNQISTGAAEMIFHFLSAAGCLPGIYLGFHIGKPVLAAIMPFCAFTLWMYSSYYKRRMLSGNLMIATLTFLMVLLPGLFEPNLYPNIIYLLNYGILAFLITLAREITKDIEDIEGDKEMQCSTLPIRYGKKVSAFICAGILSLTASFAGLVSWKYFQESAVVDWMNVFLAFSLPLLLCMYLVIKADEKSDYRFVSNFLKGYLALGLLSMFPFWYYFLR